MNTFELTELLARKYKTDTGVLFIKEVANSTGSNTRRYADAVTVSLWPSKGYLIQGYEIKVSKSDLEHELQDVTKWEAVGQFCDKWWLVVSDKKIVDLERLPAVWGVMYPTKSGAMRILKPATKLSPKPFTRGFMSSLLRKAADHCKVSNKLAAEYTRGRNDGYRAGQESTHSSCDRENKRLQESIEAFEKASGVKIEIYGSERLGEDFKLWREGKGKLSAMLLSVGRIEISLQKTNKNLETLKGCLGSAKSAAKESSSINNRK
ncbi:MAG: hypothetical protein FVQ79_11830 [Planctomycetes bacterium]|nr:hypothetical protein [Planctomycetota bacterium]